MIERGYLVKSTIMHHWPAALIPVIITLMLLCTRTPSMSTICPLLPLTDLQTATLPLARDPTNGPSAPVPLFLPLEANAEMGLLPPRYQYALSGNFFQKIIPGK